MQKKTAPNDRRATLKLRIEKTWTGLYGRYMVDFRDYRNEYLAANKVSSGDVVQLASGVSDMKTAQGIVTKVTEQRVCVAFDDSDAIEKLQEPFRLDRLANDASYRKIAQGLDALTQVQMNNVIETYVYTCSSDDTITLFDSASVFLAYFNAQSHALMLCRKSSHSIQA